MRVRFFGRAARKIAKTARANLVRKSALDWRWIGVGLGIPSRLGKRARAQHVAAVVLVKSEIVPKMFHVKHFGVLITREPSFPNSLEVCLKLTPWSAVVAANLSDLIRASCNFELGRHAYLGFT